MKSTKHSSAVEKVVTSTNELNVFLGRSGYVTPKQGIVVRSSDWASTRFQVHRIVSLSGKWYSSVPNSIFPPRPIFSENPVTILGEPHYLELKGYGRLGREMFFNLHESGDIFYGMFLEEAIREFDRLCQARNAGIPVPLPIAVVEIPREEYVKYGLRGFEGVLAARLRGIRSTAPEWLLELVARDSAFDATAEDPCKECAASIVRWVKKHPKGKEEGIAIAMRELEDPREPKDALCNNLARSADALLSGRKVGYLIRAARSPMRVGDPSGAEDTKDNRKIALAMGDAFRKLLEIGLLHHCPGTGNWTCAGELTDLQDTFDLASDQEDLWAHMARLGYKDLEGFIEYLIGPKHAGKLDPFFLQGICGREISLAAATEEVQKTIQEKLKTR